MKKILASAFAALTLFSTAASAKSVCDDKAGQTAKTVAQCIFSLGLFCEPAVWAYEQYKKNCNW